MALPAGRYGVTKNQLLKIKKLPMNTIKLIEELTEKFDLLGTAAFKNSTSVVTDSSDLVESGAVYDALGFGNKNLFDKSKVQGIDATVTQSSDSFRVQTSNHTWSSGRYDVNNPSKNTDFILSCKANVNTAGNFMRIQVYGSNDGTNYTSISATDNYSTTTDLLLAFNSGNYEYIRIIFYLTNGTAASADVTFEKPMIRLASVTDASYEPYHASVDESKCDNSVIGTVENGTTASQTYAVGEHFIRDGAFCTVTQAISSGGTLTEGTNYTSGDVASDIFGEVITPTAGANITLQSINCRRVGKNYFINAQIHSTANIANGATILTITHPLLAGLDTYGGTVAIDTNTGKIYSFIVRVANGGISLVYRNSEEAILDNSWLAITCNIVG